ncbi:hypothetical protein C8R43DRAFT_1135639 [Mycena crocata]|nr:hypothetical protein C8R43DRAFT_1135639 [Mycena crocata]
MSKFLKSLLWLSRSAPASETHALPASDDGQDIVGSSSSLARASYGPAQNLRLTPTCAPLCAICFVPAETQSSPAGVGIQAAVGSTSGATRVLCSWAVVPVPVSVPVPCRVPLASPYKMDSASAHRLVGSRDPCEKGVCPARRLLDAAGSTGVSPCIRAADPQNFPAHGPSTKLGSSGLPSAFPRTTASGPTLMDLALPLALLVIAVSFIAVALVLLLSAIRNRHFCMGFISGRHRTLAPFVASRFRHVLMRAPLKRCRAPPGVSSCSSVPARDVETTILDEIANNYARSVSSAQNTGTNTASGSLVPVQSGPRRSMRLHGRNDGNDPPSRSNGDDGRGPHRTPARKRHVTRSPDVVKIMYWNIYHDYLPRLHAETHGS